MNKKHNEEINKFGERICGTNMNLEHVVKEHEVIFTNELIVNQKMAQLIYENASKKFLEHIKSQSHILNMKELENEKFDKILFFKFFFLKIYNLKQLNENKFK